MVISFANDQARAQLLQEGVAHTFRLDRRKRKEGRNWVNSGRTTTKIADVYLWEVGLYAVANLRTFVATSGFGSLREWWHAIQTENWRKLKHKDMTTRGWLYKVTKVPDRLQEVVHYYKVTPPRGQISMIVPFTKQDLLDRYCQLDVIPSLMGVRDMACSRGHCSWSDYTKLRVTRLKEYKANKGQ